MNRWYLKQFEGERKVGGIDVRITLTFSISGSISAIRQLYCHLIVSLENNTNQNIWIWFDRHYVGQRLSYYKPRRVADPFGTKRVGIGQYSIKNFSENAILTSNWFLSHVTSRDTGWRRRMVGFDKSKRFTSLSGVLVI